MHEYMDKNVAFSFLIQKFIEWYQVQTPDQEYTNKFTKLFLLKMLFLVAAVKTDEGDDLLDIFDNFHALPYGPVESDIYNTITRDEILNYSITDRKLVEKIRQSQLSIPADLKSQLEKSLEKLKIKNDKLITLKPFELVDITHKWESWDKTFKYAKFTGSGSARMDLDWIRRDKNSYFGN